MSSSGSGKPEASQASTKKEEHESGKESAGYSQADTKNEDQESRKGSPESSEADTEKGDQDSGDGPAGSSEPRGEGQEQRTMDESHDLDVVLQLPAQGSYAMDARAHRQLENNIHAFCSCPCEPTRGLCHKPADWRTRTCVGCSGHRGLSAKYF